MVRVLAVSDEEMPGALDRAQRTTVDLLLGAGDLPWDHLESLADALGVPAAFVPGNHDPQVTAARRGPRGFINLDGTVATLAGLRIAGLGGCVRYNRGNHQYTQAEYALRAGALLDQIGTGSTGSSRIDILLTHAPPFGLGDEPDPSHQGIEALHEVIERSQPRWHLHGHIHPYGMAKPDRQLGTTTIRNVIPWNVLELEPATSTTGRP